MYMVDGVLYGKVWTSFRAVTTGVLTEMIFRKIGIYHGRPASILRSDIDADLPGTTAANESTSLDFDPAGLLESIRLTCQAEAFLHQM
jgi:hypothetical protein